MASQYNWVSPGAAAGASMEDLLTRRREEERQRMIDEITRQNAEQTRALQQAQMVDMDADRLARDYEAASKNWKKGDDLSGIDPRLLAEARKRGALGRLPKAPKASVSTDVTFGGVKGQPDVPMASPWAEGEEDFAALNAEAAEKQAEINARHAAPEEPEGPGTFYLGSAEDRDRERIVANLGRVLSTPNLPKDASTMLQVAAALEGDLGGIPAGAFDAMLQPGERFVHDMDDGSVTRMTVDGRPITTKDSVHIRTRPPKEIAPQWFTNTKTGQGAWFRPGDPVPPDYVKGNRPRSTGETGGKADTILPAGFAQRGATLRGLVNERGLDQDIANYAAWQQQAIGQATVSDESIRMAVQNVLDNVHPITEKPLSDPNNDEDLGPDAEELMLEMMEGGGGTSKEVGEFYRLLKSIRGY